MAATLDAVQTAMAGRIDPDLVRRFALSGPRYTSYPTADRFVESFDAAAQARWLARRGETAPDEPLSVYVHIPFCASLCYYCACNKIVTKDRRRTAAYLESLERELALVLERLAGGRALAQLHWGGGTPTYLTDEQMAALMRLLRSHFDVRADAEIALEVDPRTVSAERVALLAGLGFNRMSIGVQDFDPVVQAAVHRLQPAELTESVMAAARRHGFASINLDLIYGLPRQTLASFECTLDRLIACDPDRIALYNYAHLPMRFKPQRRIVETELPDGDTRVAIFVRALERLAEAGYVYIGLDHFAKPGDELARSLADGSLQRNFQGYSTRADCDLLALGVSGISKIGPTYAQNVRTLGEYTALLDEGRLPVLRGIELTRDDRARRAIIMALMCRGEVSMADTGSAFGLDFAQAFAAELRALRPYEALGLVTIGDDRIRVSAKGRLLVRPLCMVFDRHLTSSPTAAAYSKVV